MQAIENKELNQFTIIDLKQLYSILYFISNEEGALQELKERANLRLEGIKKLF